MRSEELETNMRGAGEWDGGERGIKVGTKRSGGKTKEGESEDTRVREEGGESSLCEASRSDMPRG